MHSFAVNFKCFIMKSPIKVPVRPRPAKQWTATAPRVPSLIRMKRSTISSDGVVQSVKKRSWWSNPAFSYALGSSGRCIKGHISLPCLSTATWRLYAPLYIARSSESARGKAVDAAGLSPSLTLGIVQADDVGDVLHAKHVHVVGRRFGKLTRANTATQIRGSCTSAASEPKTYGNILKRNRASPLNAKNLPFTTWFSHTRQLMLLLPCVCV